MINMIAKMMNVSEERTYGMERVFHYAYIAFMTVVLTFVGMLFVVIGVKIYNNPQFLSGEQHVKPQSAGEAKPLPDFISGEQSDNELLDLKP